MYTTLLQVGLMAEGSAAQRQLDVTRMLLGLTQIQSQTVSVPPSVEMTAWERSKPETIPIPCVRKAIQTIHLKL